MATGARIAGLRVPHIVRETNHGIAPKCRG